MSNLAYHVQPKRKQQYQPKVKHRVRVKKKQLFTPGERILLFVLCVLFTIGCIVIVSKQASIYQLNHDIQMLESSISTQQKINSGLEEEITELSRPERILNVAKQKGLTIMNNNVQVIGN